VSSIIATTQEFENTKLSTTVWREDDKFFTDLWPSVGKYTVKRYSALNGGFRQKDESTS
jgi:hypothetical protein